MRCWECGAEFDELNESQPVCPACGAPPGMGRDDGDVCALLDDAALIAAAPDDAEDTDPGLGLGLDQQEEPVRMPLTCRTPWMTPNRYYWRPAMPRLICRKVFECSRSRPSGSCKVSSRCHPLPQARPRTSAPRVPTGCKTAAGRFSDQVPVF